MTPHFQDSGLRPYASIDGVGFLIWHHNSEMAAMTSFDTEVLLPGE